jgi:hypothetical protein
MPAERTAIGRRPARWRPSAADTPLAPAIGESTAVSPPRLGDWALTIAAVLGIDLPASDGDPLIAPG